MKPYEKFDDFLKSEIDEDPGLKNRIKQSEALIEISISLRKMRNRRGMSQKQLAQLTGTSQANIARWESPGYTEFTLTTLMKLAEALDARFDIRLSECRVATTIKDDHFKIAGRMLGDIRSRIISSEQPISEWRLKNA